MNFDEVLHPEDQNGVMFGPERPRKALILCFDGTGNKFSGDSSDSNILKIYSLLNRQSQFTHSYYQPGIGTYIEDSALSKTSRLAKIRSFYLKAKDEAVGISFGDHVVGGYKFLMRYYASGDDIYFFGFSRGAYLARFLAQMLDAVGLLSRGNEELVRFAWKAFSEWQTRLDITEEQKAQKKKNFEFMRAFRETFSRPVTRLRFLGLFDTVNSVPRFETAWMSRTKFPYTSKSSALVIRHAVSIDERRAKFRQNLISQKRIYANNDRDSDEDVNKPRPNIKRPDPFGARFKTRVAVPTSNAQPGGGPVLSDVSANVAQIRAEEEEKEQDIQEIWFPGCHADIGGGWPLEPGMKAGLSHAPLLWMVREARKAGLPCDRLALENSGYMINHDDNDGDDDDNDQDSGSTMDKMTSPLLQTQQHDAPVQGLRENVRVQARSVEFFDLLQTASTKGMIHDSLMFKRGTSFGGVLLWRAMEYLPFRRMDLQPDGTWKPIRWPLPCGETRDMPDDAWIHNTALSRMQADSSYRPGNLIVGGGGRGVKTAPASYGMGKWIDYRERGDPVGEVLVRAPREQNVKVTKPNRNGATSQP